MSTEEAKWADEQKDVVADAKKLASSPRRKLLEAKAKDKETGEVMQRQVSKIHDPLLCVYGPDCGL